MAACNVAVQWERQIFFFFFYFFIWIRNGFLKTYMMTFFFIPATYHFTRLRCLKFFFIFFLILYIIYPPVEKSLYNWCKSKLKDNAGKHVRSCVADIASSSLVSTLVVAWSFSSYTVIRYTFSPAQLSTQWHQLRHFLFLSDWVDFLFFCSSFSSRRYSLVSKLISFRILCGIKTTWNREGRQQQNFTYRSDPERCKRCQFKKCFWLSPHLLLSLNNQREQNLMEEIVVGTTTICIHARLFVSHLPTPPDQIRFSGFRLWLFFF